MTLSRILVPPGLVRNLKAAHSPPLDYRPLPPSLAVRQQPLNDPTDFICRFLFLTVSRLYSTTCALHKYTWSGILLSLHMPAYTPPLYISLIPLMLPLIVQSRGIQTRPTHTVCNSRWYRLVSCPQILHASRLYPCSLACVSLQTPAYLIWYGYTASFFWPFVIPVHALCAS